MACARCDTGKVQILGSHDGPIARVGIPAMASSSLLQVDDYKC